MKVNGKSKFSEVILIKKYKLHVYFKLILVNNGNITAIRSFFISNEQHDPMHIKTFRN